MGASFEVDPCVKGSTASHVLVDAVGMVQGLSQLATLPEPPTGAIRVLLSSVRFDQTDQPSTTRKRKSDEAKQTPEKRQKGKENGETVSCELCPRTYVNKWNLARHVLKAHPTKRRRLVHTEVFECEECDYMCASQGALETHLDTHITSTEGTRCPRYKCAFCDKERASIYNHYASVHRIEYPEQIMFDNGNVLVHSSINPDEGKAPWFIKEKEKIIRYTDVTCRLCEAETCFDNQVRLIDHYMVDHMVNPDMLENLKHVFRAEKGAHLIDLPASQTPKRKQSDMTKRTPIQQKVSRTEGEGARHSAKVDLKRLFEHLAAKKPDVKGFHCEECDMVCTTAALLNKHKNDKHTPKIEDKAKCKKYKCCLCSRDLIGIYKHYGKIHQIEYPEQILFDNGNVLVFTDIYTDNGQAPWFISQKEKAENKYKSSTCRLCDADFYGTGINLDKHYLVEHKVEPDALKRLNNLRCLFRAEKGAHLVDKPTSRPIRRASTYQGTSRPANSERQCKTVSNDAYNSKSGAIEQDVIGLIIYQCVECEIAATTCDASIEHAQLHYLADYRAIPQTCGVCNFAFEAQCFADHSSNHLQCNEYTIVKFDPSKLLSKWSDMFQGLSETHADRIKSSSTYQHTRRVKMNSNIDSGIPLYQCGKCDLYVRPKDVEGHCFNYNCIENQSPGHFCSDCEIYFYTSVALTEHEKDHRRYGADSFRTVSFNCKEDEPINRALQNLRSSGPSKDTQGETSVEKQQKNRGVKIIEDMVISVFCDECKQSILYSEFEAHAAMHRNENADSSQCEVSQRTEEIQERHSANANDKNTQNSEADMSQTKAVNGEGTVEPWNSDTDSSYSQPLVSSFDVHVEVHVQKEEDESLQNENDMQNHSEAQYILEEFSEEMANDLKRDIEHLGLELFGMAHIPHKNMTGHDLLELRSELTTLKESGSDLGNRLSEDAIDEIQDVTNLNNGTQNANDLNDIFEISDDEEFQDEVEIGRDSRPSSRDILSRMLSRED